MSRLNVLQWSTADRRLIFDFFNKSDTDIQQDVETIKEWTSKQPHFPETAEDRLIERYLLTNKFRIEIVKEKLERYYNVRNLMPEFYRYPSDNAIKEIRKVVHYVPLPKLTKDFCRIIIAKAIGKNIDNFDPLNYISHTLNISEIRMREDMLLKEIHVYDFEHFKLSNIKKLTPTILKKCIFLVEKVFSNAIKEIHFVNTPHYADKLLMFVNATLNPKLTRRVFLHKDVDSLKKMISTEILPKDYGGDEKSLQELSDEWNEVLLKHEGLYHHLMTTTVDQSLLPEQRRFSNGIFGVYGNFKQLNLD